MREEIDGGVIFFKKGIARKYLFLKRRAGWLDLPKGHKWKKENVEEAAIREAEEETGLKVEELDPYFSYSYAYKVGKNKRMKTVTIFIANKYSGKIRISDEHVGYEWLTLGQALRKLKFANVKDMLKNADAYIGKCSEMEKLNSEYERLAHAKGWKLSKRLVKGEGNLLAETMLIGQAPGSDEDKKGKPFVGRSGKLLDELLALAGYSRKEVYITSTVQFFPPKNRAPTKREIELCRPFLERQIKIINPKLIVLLGNVALNALLHMGRCMSLHGHVVNKDGVYYFITLHPAAAIRIKKNMPIIRKDFEKLGMLRSKLMQQKQHRQIQMQQEH